MAHEFIEKNGVAYLLYRQGGLKDLATYKKLVNNYLRKKSITVIVIDFTSSTAFNLMENEFVIDTITQATKKGRTLRIIASTSLYKDLASLDLFTTETITLHNDFVSFLRFSA